jgi:hypothetical protein
MQRHERHDPGRPPKRPDPRNTQAKWLLFTIAILLGLLASQVIKRFM